MRLVTSAKQAESYLLKKKKELVAQGYLPKGTGLQCAVKDGKFQIKVSYARSAQYYDTAFAYSYGKEGAVAADFKKRESGYLGHGFRRAGQCVVKKDGQELRMSIMNRANKKPAVVKEYNY